MSMLLAMILVPVVAAHPCDDGGCGSNGTSVDGLNRPASLATVSLPPQVEPTSPCPPWRCSNGTSATGLTRPASPATVSLPPQIGTAGCAPWDCVNGTSATGLLPAASELRIRSVELPSVR